jgi:GLPGLI family protein
MKQVFFSLAFSLLILPVHAQIKEGKIIYKSSTQVKVLTNNPVFENMAKQAQHNQFELLFANNQTLWKKAGEDHTTWDSQDGKVRFTMIVPEGNAVIYNDLTGLRKTEQRELAEKKYLVQDSIRRMDWKISDEVKPILNHNCQKATAQVISQAPGTAEKNSGSSSEIISDTMNIIAWFTTDIPVSSGPDSCQGQLPGMILELNENNGATIYTATAISTTVNIADIKEPKTGKKVTPSEYQKEKQRILQNMSGNNGKIYKTKIGD